MSIFRSIRGRRRRHHEASPKSWACCALAPEIQQHILSMPEVAYRPAVTERALRPIAQPENLNNQKAKFQELIKQVK